MEFSQEFIDNVAFAFKGCNELQTENKQLRALKCPPISDGDTCICPIEELETVLIERDDKIKALEKDYNCVKSLCDSMDEFGEPMKDNQWTELGERIYEIVAEKAGRIKELEDCLISIRKSTEIMEARRFAEQALKG